VDGFHKMQLEVCEKDYSHGLGYVFKAQLQKAGSETGFAQSGLMVKP